MYLKKHTYKNCSSIADTQTKSHHFSLNKITGTQKCKSLKVPSNMLMRRYNIHSSKVCKLRISNGNHSCCVRIYTMHNRTRAVYKGTLVGVYTHLLPSFSPPSMAIIFSARASGYNHCMTFSLAKHKLFVNVSLLM